MRLNPHINRIAAFMTALSIVITIVMLNGKFLGIPSAYAAPAYQTRLFDVRKVHEMEIIMDSWEDFLKTCENEEYAPCSVVIDGTRLDYVGIRAKGNTSLAQVRMTNTQRYSLKIEFNHYETGKTYYGLDKLCLNNMIQDNTYMKDYLAYRIIREFGAPAPLCSYVQVKVNDKIWGLFLAVEAVEESFLRRNYGAYHSGALYKPDVVGGPPPMPPGQGMGGPPQMPPGQGMGSEEGMGSEDMRLRYIDDNPDSYSNIFASAKTPVTKANQLRLIRALKALKEQKNLERTLDIDATLRYFVAHNYTVNGDSYTGGMIHNYYLYENGGRLSMIPWDYNLAFGGFQNRNASHAVNDPLDSPLSVSGDGSRPMADWIFSEAYLKDYHAYFECFLNEVDIPRIIEQAYNMISPYAAQEETDPTAFCTREQFEEGAAMLRTFCELRSESLWGQLKGEIPSTDSAQAEKPDPLIDASSVNLAAMGSMGGPGGPP